MLSYFCLPWYGRTNYINRLPANIRLLLTIGTAYRTA